MRRSLLLAPLFVGLLPASFASAQCPDGSAVCFQASASVSASASVNTPDVAPPNTVLVTPVPPPPPPQQIVVVPAPPPQAAGTIVVVRQSPIPQPTPVVVRPVVRPQADGERNRRFALSGRLGFVGGGGIEMGGAQIGIRFRPSRMFALELSGGVFGGTDYNSLDRTEYLFSLDAMFFVPRASRFQLYFLLGPNVSVANVSGYHTGYRTDINDQWGYFGVHAGVGLEWRIFSRLAISADVRGFVRQRASFLDREEFYDPETGRRTDTSAGAILSLGAHLYF